MVFPKWKALDLLEALLVELSIRRVAMLPSEIFHRAREEADLPVAVMSAEAV